MTSFVRTWNAAYEASPADSQSASQGATRIRELKVDIQERLEVDHSHAGDTDDGAHKKITLVDPLGAKPTQANDETYIYSKDVAGTAELFFEDEAGNEVQLTEGGILKGALLITNDLSDLDTVATARTNLGLDALAVLAQIQPSTHMDDTITTEGSEVITTGSSWVPPAGLYNMVPSASGASLQIYVSGSWRGYIVNTSTDMAGTFFCDGTNMRVYNSNASSNTVYWQRFDG